MNTVASKASHYPLTPTIKKVRFVFHPRGWRGEFAIFGFMYGWENSLIVVGAI